MGFIFERFIKTLLKVVFHIQKQLLGFNKLS